MMVMADSAAARMTSCVVDSVKVELEMEGSWVILMIEVMPALRKVVMVLVMVDLGWKANGSVKMIGEYGGREGKLRVTHNTPMLIATITPIFSFRFMVRVQMIFQGTTAKTISMAPE